MVVHYTLFASCAFGYHALYFQIQKNARAGNSYGEGWEPKIYDLFAYYKPLTLQRLICERTWSFSRFTRDSSQHRLRDKLESISHSRRNSTDFLRSRDGNCGASRSCRYLIYGLSQQILTQVLDASTKWISSSGYNP